MTHHFPLSPCCSRCDSAAHLICVAVDSHDAVPDAPALRRIRRLVCMHARTSAERRAGWCRVLARGSCSRVVRALSWPRSSRHLSQGGILRGAFSSPKMSQAQCKGASPRPPLPSGPRIKPGCVDCGCNIVAAITTATFAFSIAHRAHRRAHRAYRPARRPSCPHCHAWRPCRCR